MKTSFTLKICQCIMAIAFFSSVINAASAAPSAIKKTSQDKPTLLKGSVNQLLLLCSNVGITLDKNDLPGKVTAVKLGTSAAYFGVSENDQVLAATLENNQLCLRLDRAGRKFLLRLPLSASALRAATNAGANRGMPELKLKLNTTSKEFLLGRLGEVGKDSPEQREAFKNFCIKHSPNLPKPKMVSKLKDIRALQDYEIVLLVDHSGSMSQKIARTVGDHEVGLKDTKWQWVQTQMAGMSNEFSSAFKRGIRLIMFNSGFEVYENCMPSQLLRIFKMTNSDGENYLIPPLKEELRRKIISGKPTIICIVTDGLRLCNYGDLREYIVETTQAIPGKYDLTIYFLIVKSEEPEKPDIELNTLKQDIMSAGAKFDVVHVKSFQEIEQRGLTNILVDIATAE